MPKVTDINILETDGQTTIRVKAKDDTQVMGIRVTIIDNDRQEVISGEAVPDIYLSKWEFSAGKLPEVPAGYFVEAMARDMAGNTSTLTMMLDT